MEKDIKKSEIAICKINSDYNKIKKKNNTINFNRETFLQGIILSEILGPPKSRKKHGVHNEI